MPDITSFGNQSESALANYTEGERAALRELMDKGEAEKQRIYQEMLLEKWGGRTKDGKYNPRADWLGDASIEKGFPKLRDDKAKINMAMVLENQSQYQRSKEARVKNGRVLVQDTTTTDAALATRFVLPIVRRAYAQIMQGDWASVQPMHGPTGYVYFLDFLRENTNGTVKSNILSVDYQWMEAAELSVPVKAKLALTRTSISVQKNIMGMAWSLEVMEDAQAQLSIDVEQELLSAFTEEFVRVLFNRHIQKIVAAVGAASVGNNLPSPWDAGPSAITIPNRSSNTITDYKQIVYGYLLDGDTAFRRANRIPADGIIAGYGMAGFLSKLLTATATGANDAPDLTSGLGITHYGTYIERFQIWGTEFLADNTAFLYRRNPDPLRASFVYAPYIPVQIMPSLYADYDATTGNYQNKDAFTRNIRERSGELVTKPYGFQEIVGPAGGLAQFG